MTSPLIFFINGCLQITKKCNILSDQYNEPNNYIMRFLTEAKEPTKIRVSLWDESDNFIEHTESVNGLHIIKVDCTNFIDKYNWQNLTYLRIRYKISIVDVNDQPLFKGSFPLIAPEHPQSLSMCSVSHNTVVLNSSSQPNLWGDLHQRNPDIILHLGGQVNGDPLVDSLTGYNNNSCNTDEVQIAYDELYRQAYSQPTQAEAMRNSLNVMILGDTDICSNFATFSGSGWKVKSNNTFTPYYIAGTSAYLKYQYQLHTDIDNQDLNINSIQHRILMGKHPIYYNLHYGKYSIVSLDQRHQLYHHKQLFTNDQLYWIQYVLTESNNQNIVILTSKPIGEINKTYALLHGLISANCRDEPLHPDHYNQTLELFNTLNIVKQTKNGLSSNKKANINIFLLSGGQKNYINRIYQKAISTNEYGEINKSLLAIQLVCGSIAGQSISHSGIFTRFSHWLQHKLTCYNMISTDISPKENLSTDNGYGILYNDTLSSYYVEWPKEDDQWMCNSIYVESNE